MVKENKKFRLVERLIKESEGSEWDNIKKEWFLYTLYVSPEDEYCICGKEIKNVCLITNRINQRVLKIGSCCLQKVLEIPSERFMKRIQVIKKDPYQSIYDEKYLLFFFKKNIINYEEWNLYRFTIRKRVATLSKRVLKHRFLSNHKMLLYMTEQKRKYADLIMTAGIY